MKVIGQRLVLEEPVNDGTGRTEVWFRNPKPHAEQRDRMLMERAVEEGRMKPEALYERPKSKFKKYQQKNGKGNGKQKPKNKHRRKQELVTKAMIGQAVVDTEKMQQEEHRIRMEDAEAKTKQQELRAEVAEEVASQEPEEIASGPVTKLVEGLDKSIGTVGEVIGSQLTALCGGAVPNTEPQTD